MNIAIVKYNAGNTQSVLYALERLGAEAIVTADHELLQRAQKVIFPGVGAASSAMNSLKDSGLDQLIPKLQQPVLGICVGMQLLCSHSEEDDTMCLGIVPLHVKKFLPAKTVKVPQVGWNTIYNLSSPLFKNTTNNSFIYNVHSFYVEDSEHTIAHCEYGVEYAAAIRKNNFYGVQFHAEKSGLVGDRVLQNFLNL